ncbi:MAG: hypothetical protein ACYTBV_17605, partial [Planctomycetota bacterium]
MVYADYPGHFWAVLTGAIIAVLLVIAYLGKESRKARIWNVFFWLLQFAVIGILLVILWNPSKPQMSETATRNTVLVLFDTSESMSVADEEGFSFTDLLKENEGGSSSRLDKAVGIFKDRFSPSDPEGPEYRIYGFDHHSYYSDTIETLRRWGGRTNLQSALGVLSKYELTKEAYLSGKPEEGKEMSGKGKVVG